MEKSFKSSFYQLLLFTLLAQFFTIFIAQVFSSSPLSEEVYAPFGQTAEGAVANSLPLILSVFIFGFLISLLVNFRKFNFIKAFLTIVLIFSVFSMSIILFSVLLPESIILPFLISIALSALIVLVAYFKRFMFLSKFFSLFIGAEVGGYFATILQPPTIFVLPLLLAAYDIYAVFAGPLKRIIGKPAKGRRISKKARLDFLSLLIVDFNFLKVGLGDIIFYSMLPAAGFMLFGLQKMLVTLLATNLGIVLTLYLLKKKKIPLPGLPIPMLLGILALVFL